jgi:hypothetical protein
MQRILTKPIEIPWLTGIIVASSIVTGVAYLLEGRGRSGFEILCGEMAYFFGPLLCAFLWVRLASEIIWKRGGHPWALFIGSLFGFGTFYLWIYQFGHH